MPSLIEGEARQAVKRAVPKSTNKIQAAGVARLYIAYPDKHRWTYTGLQGAVVLANDLVGNTFWLKMVDISPANRGVIWDQEIYDTFLYNQDRVFFHTFELEECLAGFSFVDDKEAKQFKKKMDEREKNAHKNTKANPFGNVSGEQTDGSSMEIKSHSRLGGIGRNLLHGHRHSSAPHGPPAQSMIPRKEVSLPSSTGSPKQDESVLDNIDPTVLQELLGLGLTKDQLVENADFIKSYIAQRQSQPDTPDRRQKAPPPPQPAQPLTPQDTGNTSTSRRTAPPPTPPPARAATRQDSVPPPSPPSENEPSPARTPAQPSFRVPPPLADAGKFAHDLSSPSSPSRPKAGSNTQSVPGPPPPPRPPKTPLDEEKSSNVFAVPPPFTGERKPVPPPSRATAPPPPPTRRSGHNPGPPPPPSRDNSVAYAVPPATASPPPLPPKTPNAPATTSPRPLPPGRDSRSGPPPPPMPSKNDAPPPPPMPSRNDAPPPPPMPSRSNAPPPPPPPGNSAGPPPPPLPPGMTPVTANTPALPQSGGRDGLLSDIRGGAKLKKVSEAEKRDRSAAAVAGGGGDSGGGASSSAPAPAAGDAGGLAGALASALAARKSKVSQSDDEDDHDDW